MKKNITFRTIFTGLIFLCFVLGCTKEGDVGPRGEDGINGVDGIDGSRIYSGTTAPATTLGSEGDYYFRTSNSDFYGPKTASGWGTPISLSGAAGSPGANGAPGSKILSGASTPTTAIGAVGDYYIHTGTANLYGPKTASGWGSPIMNLRGAQGPTGPQGPPGTANVIYSDWITPPTGTTYSFQISAPQLTQAIFDRGQIAVYMKYTNHDRSEIIQLGEGTFYTTEFKIGYRSWVGTIEIYQQGTSTPISNTMPNVAFRYVLIPGGIAASARVNFSNFNQVKTAFNIPD